MVVKIVMTPGSSVVVVGVCMIVTVAVAVVLDWTTFHGSFRE